MQKLLVQTRASEKDPPITEQKIEGHPFAEFFRNAGIKVLTEELVASCHGNTDHSLEAAHQMQTLSNKGHKIVSIQTGGLYFARPSLEAVHATTVPIISVPLGGLDAFLAPNLPAGVASIGGVSPGNYNTAGRIAKEILTGTFKGVYLWGIQSTRLDEAIKQLKIPVLGRINPTRPKSVDEIIIGEINPTELQKFEISTPLGIFSMAVDPNYIMRATKEAHHSAYVRGPENLAYFAAKILSTENPEVAGTLFAAKENKARTYKKPEIKLEAFS